jgi:gliding motility-associated-like protein
LETTVPLNNPNAIDIAGTYFIKGDNGNGCSSVMYVAVAINIAASLSTNNITVCGSADITGANVKNASPSSFSSYTYWLDAQATQAIIEPAKITSSGVYYILGNGYNGCNVTKPLTVTVNPFADFIIPAGVTTTIPNAVDLTSVVPNNGLIYTYWKDKNATQAVTDPTNLFLEGTYYIKGNNTFGCAVTKPLNVIVKDAVVVPPNVFSPNGDGVNDTWEIPLLKYYPYCSVDIFDRNGHNIFSSKGYNKSWDGMFKGSQLPVTTYYYIIKIKPESKPVSGGVTIIK